MHASSSSSLTFRALVAVVVFGMTASGVSSAKASIVWELRTMDGLFKATFVLDPSDPNFQPNGSIALGFGIQSITVDDGTGFGFLGPLHSSPLKLGPDPADPTGSFTAGFLMGEDSWKELWVSRSLDPIFAYSVYIPTEPISIRGPAPSGGIEAFVDRYGGGSYSNVAAFYAIPEPTSLLIWSLLFFFLGSVAAGRLRMVRRS